MFKLGKKAPRRLLSTPALGDFLDKAATWPSVAAQGWEYAIPSGGLDMLGNDQYGDCAEAGAMHLIQAQTANTGQPLTGTLQQTLDLYSAVTGFNPADPSTDQGTDLLSLLQYWKTTGIMVTDANGNPVVHKILGWASLDLTSIAQIRYASYIFGGTYLGIRCPQSALADTSNWTYVPNSPIDGGHCITGVGQGAAGGHVVSWGKSIPFDWGFMAQYFDEGFIVVSEDWVGAQGKSPSGLDLAGLTAAMAAL
jgi:hypothetical protein